MIPIQQLWIDDLRPAPEGWLWAKTSAEAIAILSSPDYDVRVISFDHDLGGDDTAMKVAVYLEDRAYENVGPRIEWTVHSANPIGRIALEAALRSCDRYWDMHNK